jgi:hypothetical protein
VQILTSRIIKRKEGQRPSDFGCFLLFDLAQTITANSCPNRENGIYCGRSEGPVVIIGYYTIADAAQQSQICPKDCSGGKAVGNAVTFLKEAQGLL